MSNGTTGGGAAPRALGPDYGASVSFDEAFDLRTLYVLARRVTTEQPLVVFGFGLAIGLVTYALDVRFAFPLGIPTERAVAGSLVGLWVHHAFGLGLGGPFGGALTASVLSVVADRARGDDVDVLEGFVRPKMLGRGALYGLAAMIVEMFAALPGVGVAIWGAHSGSAALSAVGLFLGVALTAAARMALAPGLWAMAVDDLPVQYALGQSPAALVRYPVTMITLFAVYAISLAVGFLACIVPAFAVLGVFHVAVGSAWVLFGSTARELKSNPLFDGLVPDRKL